MTSVTVQLTNEAGLHARPANDFVRIAQKFVSNISVVKDGVKVNGKSILHILTLGATSGSIISIEAEGKDEEKAINTLKELIENGFTNT